MRKLLTTLVILVLAKTAIFSQTAPITFSLPTTKFCPGQIFPIEFTFDPTLAGHTFQVQLSNSSGSFSSGVSVLGTGTSSPIACTMISTTISSPSSYKVRILDNTAPTNFSDESPTITNNTLNSSMIWYPLDTLGNSNFSTTLCTGSSLKLFTNMLLHDDYGATYSWKNTSNPSVTLGTQYKYIVNQAGNYTVTVNKMGCSMGTNPSIGISYSSTISSFLAYPGELHCTGVTIPIKPTYNSESVIYEWKKDGVIIANTGKYDVTSSGIYSLKITDNTCQITHTSVFNFSNSVPIQIASLSDTIEICNGSTAYLYNNANFITGNTTQWYRDGQLISPQPQNTFTRSFGTSIAGTYTVKLTEGNCSAISNPVVLKSVNSFTKPTFSVNLEDTTCVIFPILKANVYDYFSGQIQWVKNGVDISGATSKSYSTSSQGTGRYALRITEGSCQSTSNEVNIVSVTNNPPYVIISTPNLCSTSFTLSLKNSRSSYSFVQYQWFKDGIAISGATSATYNATISGVYKVRVSMTISSCVGFSQDLPVTITANLGKLVIELRNDNVGIAKNFQCANNLSMIMIKSSSFNYYSTTWKRNGIAFTNPSGASNYFYPTQSGSYSVQYNFGSCTVESNIIKINIGDKQQSIKTNNWNDTSSWACGTIPTITDEVIINKGHTISLPDNYTGFLKNLELNGSLNKGLNAQLKFLTN
jgi:trimeric autotransporter adhesin